MSHLKSRFHLFIVFYLSFVHVHNSLKSMSVPHSHPELLNHAGALGIYSYYYNMTTPTKRSLQMKSPEPALSPIPTPIRVPTPISINKQPIIPILETKSLAAPSTIEILKNCVNDLTGKDKIAKIFQYTIRLLISLDNEFSKNEKFNNLLACSILAIIVRKLTGLLNGLSVYRQMLRAGTVPFRFINLINDFKISIKILTSKRDKNAIKLKKFIEFWCNYNMLSKLGNFYYAWFDECLLAFKIGIFDQKSWKKYFLICEDHEVLSWFLTIILGLRSDFTKLKTLNKNEQIIVLNENVKLRTKKILSNLRNDIKLENNNSVSNVSTTELIRIKNEKWFTLIDTVRLTSDLIYDASFVFNKKMYQPLHLSFGVLSGILGFYKVWVVEKEKLIKQYNNNQS